MPLFHYKKKYVKYYFSVKDIVCLEISNTCLVSDENEMALIKLNEAMHLVERQNQRP